MDKNNEAVEELEVQDDEVMTKVGRLIFELGEICEEEDINFIATATRTGDEKTVIGTVNGEIDELVFLVEINKSRIEKEAGIPYELLTIFGSSYKNQEGNRDE